MARHPGLNTVRDVRDAMKPYPDIPVPTAYSMLGTRPLHDVTDATALTTEEQELFTRLLALLNAATDPGAGYVGVRWMTVHTQELGGRTAIEALRLEEGARTVMTILRRRQADLGYQLAHR